MRQFLSSAGVSDRLLGLGAQSRRCDSVWAFLPSACQCRPLLRHSCHHHPAVQRVHKRKIKRFVLLLLLSVKHAHEKDTYLGEQQLVEHSQDEKSPVDVKHQQDTQHDIEEVVAEKGREIVQRIHPRAVNHPAKTRMSN